MPSIIRDDIRDDRRAISAGARAGAGAGRAFGRLVFLAALLAAGGGTVLAAGPRPGARGCHNMLVLRVVDGDTVYGYIDTSDPIVAVKTKLRLAGIDTPERGRRAMCPEEARMAERARGYMRGLLRQAIATRTRKLARACAVRRGKYALRRLGRLEVRHGRRWVDLGRIMLKRGFALPIGPRGRRAGKAWCACLRDGLCPEGYRRPRERT